ncbi:hypothetical protein [Algoriphagus boritolerans]|uniref:Uncharacterized protein n=1 Tax=Algoriphagus boritolerans DSM 17298 = JCM 18970 TaxID=1120964 RepID=A0A1H5SR84_9BACT|nr:hypothetical protein [Algoriphagus boritolerans]SEF53152.1 hypothetical protein SAMN03080598_00478 [Algoriphagus boritolerans DSM 17298 = JCM 18970]
MRKAVAIALLLCFAIYHFGYYAFYYSYQYSLESSWKDKIYGEQVGTLEERMMEIPLSAPYMANQEDFQLTNTRFEKDGKYFRAIKQRYQNDTLQVVYVPDTARSVLESTVKSWISSLTDDDLPQDQKGKMQLKLFAKDYLEPEVYQTDLVPQISVKNMIGFIFSAYMSPYFTLDSPPPQVS